MKNTVKTSRTAGQLEKMFRELNKHYYNGELPEPIITLKKTPSAYGHITTVKTWTVSTEQGSGQRYEINISTATLDRPIENTTATLLHEMVHEYCMETGIKDTSNNGVYHNRRFKEQAEAHGLTVDHHEKYGWTITSPSEELLDFIIFQGWQDIQMTEGLTWADMCGTGTASKGRVRVVLFVSAHTKREDTMETINSRIVSLRKDAGLSQQQLADDLNLSRRAVSLWETGRRAPDLQSALLLADYFHTTLDRLVKGEHS